MKEWVFQLSKDDYELLGPVRCMPGLQAAIEENKIWLRGITAASVPNFSLLKLPLKKTFLLDEEGYLFLTGAVTPVEKLPALIWQPVATFITIEAPVSFLPGKTNSKACIYLKNSHEERPGIALLTTLSAWKSYGETAPDIRLKSLRFAVSENEEVLITGTPLPPLPGQEYWSYENLLLPSGYDFEIPVMATLVGQQLHGNDDIIVFDAGAGWQRIPASYFVPATRSSIRLTQVKPTHD